MSITRVVKLPFINRRVRILYFSVFVAIIVASVGAFAASVTITSTNSAGYQGVYVNANGYYSVSNTAYNVVEAAQSATTQPLAWSNGATGYVNALVAGDWELSYTLTINAGGLTSHTYTITVYSTAAAGTTSTLYTFQFTSPASITAGQTMTIIWDTSATTWTAPAALTVTIV
ncbi:hypothetical protein J2P12_01860 [Candidatus Bathyarchaeota archaeon]|nr:hypothetical protein [Candidatus Bathyarchaeota archaeon]